MVGGGTRNFGIGRSRGKRAGQPGGLGVGRRIQQAKNSRRLVPLLGCQQKATGPHRIAVVGLSSTDQQQVVVRGSQCRYRVGITSDTAGVVEDSESVPEPIREKEIGGGRGGDLALVDAHDGQYRCVVQWQFEPADHLDCIRLGPCRNGFAGGGFQCQPDGLDGVEVGSHCRGNLADQADGFLNVSGRSEQDMAVSVVPVDLSSCVDQGEQACQGNGPLGQRPDGAVFQIEQWIEQTEEEMQRLLQRAGGVPGGVELSWQLDTAPRGARTGNCPGP